MLVLSIIICTTTDKLLQSIICFEVVMLRRTIKLRLDPQLANESSDGEVSVLFLGI